MSVVIQASYKGGLRCEATHVPSGAKLLTDAPVDNHGKGEAFSPTDLVATGALCCMMTILGIQADKHGLSLEGTKGDVEKIMSMDTPRRIQKLRISLRIGGVPVDLQSRIEAALLKCPVLASVHELTELEHDIQWLN